MFPFGCSAVIPFLDHRMAGDAVAVAQDSSSSDSVQPEAAVDAPTWRLLAFSCMRENFRSPEKCRIDRRRHLLGSGLGDDNI